jgi:hypothetical protein
MNAIVTLESILTPAAAPLSAETLFGTGQIETIVSAIEAQVRAEVIDISTPDGREAAKSLAYKVARSKGVLDEIGKEHVATIKAQSAKIDAERKTLRDRLDTLKAEVRGPVERWEEDEANRISSHEGALVAVIEAARQAAGKSAGLIRELIQIVAGYSARDWQEFKERADVAVTEALATLNGALADAEQRERDAAELEALRAEKVARDARDAEEKAAREANERAERERLAQAERDRIAAEQAAERERLHVERLETMKREQAELAKRQAEEAAARAVEAERARVAAETAAKLAADQKRADNKRRRDKVHAEIGNALTMEGGLTGEQVDWLIDALANGRVPHVSITY